MPAKTKKKPARTDQINVVLDGLHRRALEFIAERLTEELGENVKNSAALRFAIRRTAKDFGYETKKP